MSTYLEGDTCARRALIRVCAMIDEMRWFGEDGIIPEEDHEVFLERGSMLEVSVFWREHLLSVQAWAKPRDIYVGSDPSCDFILEDEHWPAPRFPLITHEGDQWFLTAFYGLDAMLYGEDHQIDARAVMRRAQLRPHGAWKGAWCIPLDTPRIIDAEHQATSPQLNEEIFTGATVHVGDLRYQIRIVDQEERVGPLGPVDATPLPFISVSAMLHIAFLSLVLAMPPGLSPLEELDLPPSQDRVVQAIVVPPRVVLPVRPQGQDLQGDGEDDVLGQRHAGEEGSAGAKQLDESILMPNQERLAIEKRDDEKSLRTAKARENTALGGPENAGVLSVLDGLGTLAGEADTSSGESELSTIGRIKDADFGDAVGDEGLGTTSTGRGAGAVKGESVGISMTMGLERSAMGGRGVAPRLERRAAEIDDIYFKRGGKKSSEAGKADCLSRSMVKRAISRRRNQIRACYEAELLRDRDLEGSVQVRLTIGQDGKVSDFYVTKNTTGKDEIPRCLQHKLRDLEFPAFDQCEQVVINHPFNFPPKQLLVLPTF